MRKFKISYPVPDEVQLMDTPSKRIYRHKNITIEEVIYTEEEAIQEQKELVRVVSGYTYKSDQEALEDFISVNWAQEIKE